MIVFVFVLCCHCTVHVYDEIRENKTAKLFQSSILDSCCGGQSSCLPIANAPIPHTQTVTARLCSARQPSESVRRLLNESAKKLLCARRRGKPPSRRRPLRRAAPARAAASSRLYLAEATRAPPRRTSSSPFPGATPRRCRSRAGWCWAATAPRAPPS